MKNKTYIWTLTLFVVFINVGIALFCIITTTHNYSGLTESYLREHYFLVNSITKDIRVLENGWNTVEESVNYACDAYKQQYTSQNIYLQVYKDAKCIYSTLPSDLKLNMETINREENTTVLRLIKQDDKKYVQIIGNLFNEYSECTLVYYADITSTVYGWQKMNCFLFIAGMFFSFILSICLFELLKYIFAPLEEISCVSNKIANGEYKQRLEIKGGLEISEVVQSFNTMSEKIKDQMEALEAYAEEKQRLIDDMAHELGTPLTAIYGYAEYMLKTHLNEEDRYTFLQYILSESKRLKNISENLLDMAVMREEKEIEMMPIQINQLFKKVHQTENIKLKEKEIEFLYDSKIEKIQGNEALIESLVMNLLDNAIKACKPKGKITMRAYSENDKKIIEVQDDGKGMTSEQLLHVKEAFYRVDKSRSRKEGGNGLGLALCEQIAKKHGAELMIESQFNEGTVVKVIF
ncbi:MAG: HAMP domain-containing histidine kinase [Cellulosilyticum sp.]|nr:HAMP domain-containing histidine kinase [Cellulosilyticum sp.]